MRALLVMVLAFVVGAALVFNLPLGDAPAPTPPNEQEMRRSAGELEAADESPSSREAVATGDEAPVRLRRDLTPEGGEKVAAPGFARGRVIDQRGDPIAGARVALVDKPRDMGNVEVRGFGELMETNATTTDPEGRFEVRLEEVGEFELRAQHTSHPSSTITGELEASGTSVEELEIVLVDGASIRGRIVGAPDGLRLTATARPVDREGAGASVGMINIDFSALMEDFELPIGARTSSVAKDGTFVLEGLKPNAEFQVYATCERLDGTGQIGCTNVVSAVAGAPNVELTYRESLVITFRVVDAETGSPIETLDIEAGLQREVKIMGLGVPVPMTRAVPQKEFEGGAVELRDLRPDEDSSTAVVSVAALGYRSFKKDDIELPEGGRIDLGLIRLEQAPILVVSVRTKDGEPVEGADVSLAPVEPEVEGGTGSVSFSTEVDSPFGVDSESFAGSLDDESTTTDREGIARLTAPAGDDGLLRVVSSGLAPHVQRLQLPQQGERTVGVEMVRGGTVTVFVADAAGNPLSEGSVERRRGEDDEESALIGGSPQVVFENVAPGRHEFRLAEGDANMEIEVTLGLAEDEWTVLEVVDGGQHELRLEAPLRSTLTGEVTLDGDPLGRANISLMQGAESAEDGVKQDMAAMGREMAQSLLGGLVDTGMVRADRDGRFTMDGVPVGAHRIRVIHRELAMPTVVPVVVREDGTSHVVVAIRDTRIHGVVVGSDGEPVPRAQIAVQIGGDEQRREMAATMAEAKGQLLSMIGGASSSVVADSDGAFELAGLKAGVPLYLHAGGSFCVASGVEVPALVEGETREGVRIVLEPAGRLMIRAVRIKGALSARATWLGDGEPRTRLTILKNGRGQIDGLRPGPWRVELEVDGVEPQEVTVPSRDAVRATFAR